MDGKEIMLRKIRIWINNDQKMFASQIIISDKMSKLELQFDEFHSSVQRFV